MQALVAYAADIPEVDLGFVFGVQLHRHQHRPELKVGCQSPRMVHPILVPLLLQAKDLLVVLHLAAAVLLDGSRHCCELEWDWSSSKPQSVSSQESSLELSHKIPIAVELMDLLRFQTLHSLSR